jgi:hypothetical protein
MEPIANGDTKSIAGAARTIYFVFGMNERSSSNPGDAKTVRAARVRE